MATFMPEHDTDAFQASVSYVQALLEDKVHWSDSPAREPSHAESDISRAR